MTGKSIRKKIHHLSKINKRPCGDPTWSLCATRIERLGGSRLQRALRGAHKLGKQRVAIFGQDRQLLAIESDAGLFQSVHETAVAKSVFSYQSIDPPDPQRPKCPLLF